METPAHEDSWVDIAGYGAWGGGSHGWLMSWTLRRREREYVRFFRNYVE